MDLNPLVSVIIPVYNTEKYLNQCVQSILSQTYNNTELILVNDGSTDMSPLICDSIASSDNRVRVIHKNNSGLSDARNKGLLFAKGKYIIYLDSDDFWTSNDSLRILVSRIEQSEFDFMCFNCSYFYSGVNRYKAWKPFDEELLGGIDKKLAIINLVRSGTFPMSACLKIINRSFLIDNQIFFKKGIFSEDIPWFLELISKSISFGFINLYIYAYRKGVNTSITSTFSETKYNDLRNIVEEGLENLKKDPYPDEVRNALISFFAYEYCILLGLASLFDSRKKKIMELKQYVWLLSYHQCPKVLKVYFIYRTFGIYVTSYFLKVYLRYYLNIK